MLKGHRRVVEPGYTPLVVNSSKQRSHLVEVRLVDDDRHPCSTTKAATVDPQTVYELSAQERLVLTALARRYLEGQEDFPLPLTWEDTARTANASLYTTKTWNFRTVANTVEEVRERLHRRGVRGLMRDEVGEPGPGQRPSSSGSAQRHTQVRIPLRPSARYGTSCAEPLSCRALS